MVRWNNCCPTIWLMNRRATIISVCCPTVHVFFPSPYLTKEVHKKSRILIHHLCDFEPAHKESFLVLRMPTSNIISDWKHGSYFIRFALSSKLVRSRAGEALWIQLRQNQRTIVLCDCFVLVESDELDKVVDQIFGVKPTQIWLQVAPD